MKPTQIVAGAVLGLGLLGVGIAGINYTPEERTVVQYVDTSLESGKAEFTKDGVTQEFTYTVDNRQRQGSVRFLVHYSDGVSAIYNFLDRGFRDGTETKGMVEIDMVMAQFTWDRKTLVITSENGSVTRLGGFKPHYDKQSNIAKQIHDQWIADQEAERVAQEREERMLNNEDFDDAISRWSKKVCVRAEGLSYITSNNIISDVMNPMIRSGELKMSQANWSRWNNMNPRLRAKNVLNAMNWDCNNVMMTAYENDINQSILFNNIFN